jgi:sugar phosphate isomerase/epimerase
VRLRCLRSTEHTLTPPAVWKKAERWLEIAETAGATGLQVGSTDAKDTIGDFDYLAKDLAGLADLAAKRGLQVSYEPCVPPNY